MRSRPHDARTVTPVHRASPHAWVVASSPVPCPGLQSWASRARLRHDGPRHDGRVLRLAAPARVRSSRPGMRCSVRPAMASPVGELRAALGAELRETHISWVLLAGDVAYKLKKPVRLPFVDYSTLERR